MILNNYIQFINEKITRVDTSEYNDMELWDLQKAGITVKEDGSLTIEKRTKELNITDSLHEYGILAYDLSDLGHPNLSIQASNAGLSSLTGVPEECESFSAFANPITNLIDGPEDASYYGVSNCVKLTSFEGAPMYCNYFEAQRTAVKNCYELDNILSEAVDVDLSNCDKLENLEGLPENTKYLYVSYCRNLTSLEHVPIDIEHIVLEGCSNLKTLYHIKEVDGQVFDTGKAFKGTGISKTEISYFLYNKTNGDDYYNNLFTHALQYSIEDLGNIYFPEEFIENLSDEHKELLRSTKGISKYKL